MVMQALSVPLVPADATTAVELRTILADVCAKSEVFSISPGSANEIILHGVGELELELMVHHLQTHHRLDFKVGAPAVRYLERITRAIEWDYTHKKQTGGSGEYAKVKLRFEPTEPGSGFQFENAVRGSAVPEAFIPAVEKGPDGRKGNRHRRRFSGRRSQMHAARRRLSRC